MFGGKSSRRGSLHDVYALLRKRITVGEYGPGHRLKELDLARELKVSRTPIRAAFLRLEQDGLIVSAPSRGVEVAPWTDHDNDEVFDLRAYLESHAAALAALRREEEHLVEMDQLNERMASLIRYRTDDFSASMEVINGQFHQLILKAARSPRLAQFVASLMNARQVTGSFFNYSDAQFEKSVADHLAIAGAIRRGNSNLARSLMDDHIRNTGAQLRLERASRPTG
ncbi:GntR family transcriptional regulator [Comamonas testosteroni]|uniref:GntR family transcriptional regulator n=1 Tax=Comamonas testosteroni TaxID=285 RepID=A0A5A7MK57_COMTE|nr:GntR family transcriptional regulator [Comamonas testosteroni]GEQ78116.1 GntR family transcriptional regulator [Comamonas testosteroni]